MQIDILRKKLDAAPLRVDGECLIWRGHKVGAYGSLYYRDHVSMGAHRAAWIVYHQQEIPKGACIMHTCDTPSCVNPRHLVLGTPKQNTHDMLRKGRFRPPNSLKTACRFGHAFDERNTAFYKERRICRRCSVRRTLEMRARRRQAQ